MVSMRMYRGEAKCDIMKRLNAQTPDVIPAQNCQVCCATARSSGVAYIGRKMKLIGIRMKPRTLLLGR